VVVEVVIAMISLVAVLQRIVTTIIALIAVVVLVIQAPKQVICVEANYWLLRRLFIKTVLIN
tara:strand:+ start:18647 stop:18832 length:186 start_codon:yes stop_codon:yes gene_type:complete